MNESQDLALKNIGTQLADIEYPAEAEMWPWYTAILILASLFIAAARLAQLKRGKHTQQKCSIQAPVEIALERLAALEQQDHHDSRAIAFRLATLLRLGMELQQLTEHAPAELDPELHQQWQAVVKQLTTLRYQSNESPDQLDPLFSQIETLLLSRLASC